MAEREVPELKQEPSSTWTGFSFMRVVIAPLKKKKKLDRTNERKKQREREITYLSKLLHFHNLLDWYMVAMETDNIEGTLDLLLFHHIHRRQDPHRWSMTSTDTEEKTSQQRKEQK